MSLTIDKDKATNGLRHHLYPEQTTKDGETWTEHLSDCEKLVFGGDEK